MLFLCTKTVPHPVPPLSNYVALGSLSLSILEKQHLSHEVFKHLNGIIDAKHLEQCLTHRKCSIRDNNVIIIAIIRYHQNSDAMLN